MEPVTLTRDMFLEIREELSGKKDDYVEIMPGIKARVVQLTADAAFALLAMNQGEEDKEDKKDDISANTYRWIAACVRDNENAPVFEVEDLKTMPFEVVQKLMRAINQINGLAGSGGSEEAEKN